LSPVEICTGKEVRVLRTDDLFLGAFALARGGSLAGVEVCGVNGRRIAYFHIEGADADETQHEYYHGPAVVNLQLLKAAVRRLKDEAFAAIRQEQRREGHASTDQPGADRRHQVAGRSRPGRR
jgi:hypothetical protein